MAKRKDTKHGKPQPRAVIDSVVLYFPLFSSLRGQFVKAKNGVAFWQYGEGCKYWYTSFALSRFDCDGTYTPPINGLMPCNQNNINVPTYNSILSAFDRIYEGYTDVIFPADRAAFEELTSNPKYYENYTTRITRIDVAFDLPRDLIPTPDELLYYITHGIGSGSRYFNVAAKQGLYFYSKKNKVWIFEKRKADGSTERLKTEKPYFMKSERRLRKAILSGEATVYIGTKNSEVKIYRKGGLIRYELSLKKQILRKILPDRRPEALVSKETVLQLFTKASACIGALFAHGQKKERCNYEVQKAILAFLQNFRTYDKAGAGYPESTAPIYNNVIIHAPTPLHERKRPPPFTRWTIK